jgi:hypothetical protein
MCWLLCLEFYLGSGCAPNHPPSPTQRRGNEMTVNEIMCAIGGMIGGWIGIWISNRWPRRKSPAQPDSAKEK